MNPISPIRSHDGKGKGGADTGNDIGMTIKKKALVQTPLDCTGSDHFVININKIPMTCQFRHQPPKVQTKSIRRLRIQPQDCRTFKGFFPTVVSVRIGMSVGARYYVERSGLTSWHRQESERMYKVMNLHKSL